MKWEIEDLWIASRTCSPKFGDGISLIAEKYKKCAGIYIRFPNHTKERAGTSLN